MDEKRLSTNEIRAIEHYSKQLTKRIEEITFRRSVLRKDIETAFSVIFEDIKGFERMIRTLFPSDILSSLLRWGVQRGVFAGNRNHLQESVNNDIILADDLFSKSKQMEYERKLTTSSEGRRILSDLGKFSGSSEMSQSSAQSSEVINMMSKSLVLDSLPPVRQKGLSSSNSVGATSIKSFHGVSKAINERRGFFWCKISILERFHRNITTKFIY